MPTAKEKSKRISRALQSNEGMALVRHIKGRNAQGEKKKKAHKALLALQASMYKSRKASGVTGPSRKALGVKEKAKAEKVPWYKKRLTKGRKAAVARHQEMKDPSTTRTKAISKATGGAIKSDVEKRKDRAKGKK